MCFYTFNWTRQCRVDRKALGEERGERDLNSGRRERSCVVCLCTNRNVIGADKILDILP